MSAGAPSEAELFGKDHLAAWAGISGQRGRKGVPPDLGVELTAARILSRLGATVPAAEALRLASQALRAAPRGATSVPRDRRELLGLRAGLFKASALRLPPGPTRDRRERRAIALYGRAYGADGDPWPLVNVASLRWLRGEAAAAERAARETLAILDRPGLDDGWREATRGEALLVLGRFDEAAEAYRKAPFATSRRFGDAASARRQALRLLGAFGLPEATRREWIASAIPRPKIGVAAGHMTDAPGRATARFPDSSSAGVGEALSGWVRARGLEFGVASAARGTDVLFHEAIRATGAMSRVVLPFPSEAFRAMSVSAGGPDWDRRFEALVGGRSKWVSVLSLQPVGSKDRWLEYGNEVLEGIAVQKADEIDADLFRVCVWDGRSGDGPGGTAATARRWIARGVPFDRIDPADPGRGAAPWHVGAADGSMDAERAPDVEGILTADAKGFGRLDEDGLQRYADHVLPAIADCLRGAGQPAGLDPLVNTWGDGLLVAHPDLGWIAEVALALRDRVARRRWDAVGLPRGLTLRIALHAGPVKRFGNSVTGRADLLGSHVGHGARLEPATLEGEVFASEGFAALQRLRCPAAARCTLAGHGSWAKDHGADVGGLPMFRVDRIGG